MKLNACLKSLKPMQFDLLGYIHENMEYSENHDSYMVWKKDRRAGSNGKGRLNAKAGDSVGCLNSSGYFTTRINKNVCGVHRLVWMFHNGDIPCGMVIDHIDGDITNNNIANLRVVTRKHNSQNCKKAKNNTSGATGISFVEKGRYRATIYKWIDPSGIVRLKYFAFSKYGLEGSFIAALEFKNHQLEDANLKGCDYTSRHGM